jgi:Ca-activated chloride channel family protein
MRVAVLPMKPEEMVNAALGQTPFQALSPDHSFWVDRLEQEWAARHGGAPTGEQLPVGEGRTSSPVRYAVSPIVIAAWEEVARDLGWPESPVGWGEVQQLAAENSAFKWSHPSTSDAAGLLATLAEFYAGAGLTRGLTVETATAPETLDYVREVEGTVRFYGEGEEVILDRLEQEGRGFLDAFVAQERVVLAWNEAHGGERLIALYPAEGTLWTDHPLVLLELGREPGEVAVTENQRATYAAFADFLRAPAAQQELLRTGYRPADLSVDLTATGSPFAGTDAVDWRQPQTTLQMPPPAVVDVVLNAWRYTKRPTNVYLVVDTSGSMDGEKIARTQEALRAFVEQVQGDRDRVGLVDFSHQVKAYTRPVLMDAANKGTLLGQIDAMYASGGTALIDAVYVAAEDLESLNDRAAINALVVMTDGLENSSERSLDELTRLLRGLDPAPVIFTVAFGDDADEAVLGEIARIGGGQFRRASETNIEELYKLISTYF